MAQAIAQPDQRNAQQNTRDPSKIRIPVIFKCGHPDLQSLPLMGIPQIMADLVTVVNLDNLMDFLKSDSVLNERLQANYELMVDEYQEVYFTFTENLQRRAYSYNEDCWGKYFVAGYVHAVQVGNVQPKQQCNCGCDCGYHGIEVHIYMFLDRDNSTDTRIRSEAIKVKNLEEEICHLQNLLRSVRDGQDINVAVDEMEAGAILEPVPYRHNDENWTLSNNDKDGIGNTTRTTKQTQPYLEPDCRISASRQFVATDIEMTDEERDGTSEHARRQQNTADIEMKDGDDDGDDDDDDDDDDDNEDFWLGMDEQIIEEEDDTNDEDYAGDGSGSEDDEYED